MTGWGAALHMLISRRYISSVRHQYLWDLLIILSRLKYVLNSIFRGQLESQGHSILCKQDRRDRVILCQSWLVLSKKINHYKFKIMLTEKTPWQRGFPGKIHQTIFEKCVFISYVLFKQTCSLKILLLNYLGMSWLVTDFFPCMNHQII